MKNFRFLLVLIHFPILGFSQHLSGLWTGVLSNDSLTVRRDQTFEMALTEYRGKVYGYSYTTFIINDTLYYIVKRVKGNVEDGICEVSDDEIVSNNFFGKRDKGVTQTFTFKLQPVDSSWYIDGDWKTNATKNYYALTGGVKLKEEKNTAKSKLFEHLGDLNLDYTNTEKPVTVKKKDKDANQKEDKINDVVKTESKNPDPVSTTTKKTTNPENNSNKTGPDKKEEEFVFADLKRTQFRMKPPADMVNERITIPSETIYFKTDSLVLSLYDNGEVDGDTVSVTLNGDVIIPNLGLKSSAFKKTIYFAPGDGDSVLLILYAENLGIYPPNTGLLIVKDGEETYQVRFKADFDRNAAIILRRKIK